MVALYAAPEALLADIGRAEALLLIDVNLPLFLGFPIRLC